MKKTFWRFMVVSALSFLIMGFVSPTAKNLPQGVRVASESVYRILVKAETELPIITYSLHEVAEILKAECSSSDRVNFNEAQNCQTLASCLRSGGIPSENIPYLKQLKHFGDRVCYKPYIDGGSAFVISHEDQTVHLMTNWHTVDEASAVTLNFLKGAIIKRPRSERIRLLKQLQFDFDLFNAAGDRVKTLESTDMEIHFMGDIMGPFAAHTESEKAIGQFLEDYVDIAFVDSEGIIGPALQASTPPVTDGKSVYAIGFPEATSGRSENSDGWGQFVSVGTTMSSTRFFDMIQPHLPPRGKDHTARKILNANPNYELTNQGIVYSDVDVVSGNSGGPLVDENGHILGLIVKSFAQTKDTIANGAITLYFPDLLSRRANMSKAKAKAE